MTARGAGASGGADSATSGTTARGAGASGGAGRVTSGRTTRGVRASVGTGAAGRQQLRDEPSGTALWVESSSSWFAGSKVCRRTPEANSRGWRRSCCKLSKERSHGSQRRVRIHRCRPPPRPTRSGGISLRMEATVVGAKNIPEKHEQSRTVEQMVDVPVRQASGEIVVIDDSGEVVTNTSQDQHDRS